MADSINRYAARRLRQLDDEDAGKGPGSAASIDDQPSAEQRAHEAKASVLGSLMTQMGELMRSRLPSNEPAAPPAPAVPAEKPKNSLSERLLRLKNRPK